MTPPVLTLDALSVSFKTDEGDLTAVDQVSLVLHRGEILGVVGESGCGKTVTSKSILRLLPELSGRISGGRILLGTEDLAQAPMARLRQVRGAEIAMIFQDPMTALNPVFTVGFQIMEAIAQHDAKASRADRRARALEMLRRVGIPAPEQRIDEYPHQLSGGMRQRVMIAMALVLEPAVLLADEPTTALDVTTQAQILDLIDDLRRERGTAVLLITHDLGVVAEVCDRVVVMYAGRVVEQATTGELFSAPRHPYTARLLESIPRAGSKTRGARLRTIAGVVPDLRSRPSGCRFRDRCFKAEPLCAQEEPELTSLPGGREVRCHYPVVSPTETP